MSKYSANGEDADIKDILESIWKMASDERNTIAVSNTSNGQGVTRDADISLASQSSGSKNSNGAKSSLRTGMVKRPFANSKRTINGHSPILSSGQLIPFTKPIKHIRSTAKASETQQLSSLKLGAHPSGNGHSAPTMTLNGTQNPPPLSTQGHRQAPTLGSQAAAPQPVTPSKAAPTTMQAGADEPKREMAPFLDTRMNRMAAAASEQKGTQGTANPNTSAPHNLLHATNTPSPGITPVEKPTMAAADVAVSGQTPTVQITSTPGTELTTTTDPSLATQRPALGSAHDAAAEMLRPVLRQWLGENMPRIVETALQIEVAESLKKDPQDSNE